MENQTNSTKQTMLNFGLILGFIGVLINVAIFAMGRTYNPHWSVSVISIAITITIIVMGIKQIKVSNSGLLSLGEALKIGIGITLISGIIMVIYNLIFTHFIEPDFYTRLVDVQQQTMLEKYPQMSDEQIQNAVEMTKKMSGPFVSSAVTLIGSLFFGFIVSIIAGLIMKKTDEEVTSI